MPDPVRIDELIIGSQQPTSTSTNNRSANLNAAGLSFQEILSQAQRANAGAIKFSAHAQTRIQSRQIAISENDLQRIEGAVQKAAGKGARESLVLLDQTAFVVSVPNKTVITVVDKDNLKQNVFTNIDSAVIA